MKPYFQRDGITLYHADCRDVLPTIEAGSVDLVLTDPPYGIGRRMHGGTWGAASKYADFRDWDVAPSDADFSEILDKSPAAIIWGGNYFDLPPSRCWLVWDKQNPVHTMADCELAWTNFDKPVKRISLPVGVH